MAKIALGKPSASAPASPVSSRREAIRDAASRVVTPLERGLESEPPLGSGDYLRKPLDEIRPDPTNPRWAETRSPTWQELTGPLDSIADAEIRKEVETIHGLKLAMAQVGQRQPIEVWRNAGWYEIVDGERRFWAGRLLGWSHIDVKLLPERPRQWKLVQFIANFQRRGLATRQELANLLNVLAEAEANNIVVQSGAELIKMVGFTQSTGFRWWGVLKGPQDVRDGILAGTITSLRDGYLIAQQADPEQRAAMIQDQTLRVAATRETPKPVVRPRSTRGRTARKLTFGKTSSTATARWIFERLDPSGDFAPQDWGDFNQLNTAWKRLMKKIEQEAAAD
jgi:ParB-like chromosome segregation protein Spo0J